LRVSRPAYETPARIEQVEAGAGAVLRTLPAELLEGWFGMKDFAHYSVVDRDGNRIARDALPYCPNTFNRQRLSDGGPLVSVYPYFCNAGPFTRGAVWGIDDGWASPFIADPYYGLSWRATRSRYTIRLWIDPAWVDGLGIDPADASVEVRVTVEDRREADRPSARASSRPVLDRDRRSPRAMWSSSRTPIVTNPDPQTLPDLIALPGWGMSTYHRKGRDYLAFNATEWNRGPGQLVVEGFRGPGDPVMDAFQYFLRDGEPVGRSPAGRLELHAGGGHDHWHFEEFTRYALLRADGEQVLASGKRSWCLAPTDAIDLTLPGASWLGYGASLSSSCGGPGAIWIREVLDVGWGDTYSQYVAGQAFEFTDLPNGTYFVRTIVNPLGALHEASSANNVADRRIRLKGPPGDRRVVVPPWHGIDTESYCPYCG
jgi:hypothetical protein